MSWNELVTEAKRQKLDPHLYSIKGIEGAGERDRIEIIRQLNDLDQQGKKWWEKTWVQILMFLGAVAGIIGIIF